MTAAGPRADDIGVAVGDDGVVEPPFGQGGGREGEEGGGGEGKEEAARSLRSLIPIETGPAIRRGFEPEMVWEQVHQLISPD